MRATSGDLRAAVIFSARRLRLANWRVRQTKQGVVFGGRGPARIMTGAGRELSREDLRRAFIQYPRGVRNAWLRVGKARYPIDVLVTPSLSETVVKKALLPRLERRARERFLIVLEQEERRFRHAGF